ncbi:MAG: hypothetical protein AAF663_12290 [Planctomycetota bacterium]
MYNTRFWFVAIGLLSFVLTLQVNGIEVIIPTFIGWVLIAWGCWGITERIKLMRATSITAICLAALTFPDLFRYALSQQSGIEKYDIIFGYPVWIAGTLTVIAILLLIAHEADQQARTGIVVISILTVIFTIATELFFFVLPFGMSWNQWLYTTVSFIYFGLTAGLCIWAAKNIV